MSDISYRKQYQIERFKMVIEQTWNKSTYIINESPGRRDTIIQRIPEAPVTEYSPFDFYRSLTAKEKDAKKISPHRQFADLSIGGKNVKLHLRYDRIKMFVDNWGLLGLSGYMGNVQSESVADFISEQRLYKSVLDIGRAIHFKKTADLITALNAFSALHHKVLQPAIVKNDSTPDALYLALQETDGPRYWYFDIDDPWFNDCYELMEQWRSGAITKDAGSDFIYWLGGNLAHTLLKRGMAGIQLSTSFNTGDVKTLWLFPSLLSALYLMYWLDLEKIKDWQICEYCGDYFISKKRLYCPPPKRCAKNAAAAKYDNSPKAKKRRQDRSKTTTKGR